MEIWNKSFANELGILAQETGGHMDGTNTIFSFLNTKYLRDASKTSLVASL